MWRVDGWQKGVQAGRWWQKGGTRLYGAYLHGCDGAACPRLLGLQGLQHFLYGSLRLRRRCLPGLRVP